MIDAAEIIQARIQRFKFVFIGGGTEVDGLKKIVEDKEVGKRSLF